MVSKSSLLIILSLVLMWANGHLIAQTLQRRNEVVIAVEKVGPAVVSLSTERLVAQEHLDPFFGFRSELFNQFFNDFFRNFERKRVESPLGSGVIIDVDGYIVTNEHVISRASKIKVTLSDGSGFDAAVISSDPINDLAILKVDSPTPLPSVKMGTSRNLMIGETVIALGNPFGLENSVTTGVLSATNRTLTFGNNEINIEYKDLLQTDALINPGNSGGPLVNINGEMIGINTAILSQAQGIGFAIPVDKVKQILVKLLNFKEINKVWLGIEVQDADDGGGIKVVAVEANSPAERAGLKEGDTVSKIDAVPITDVLDYEKYILKKDVNDSINVTVSRNRTTRMFTLTIEKAPMPAAESLARDKLGIFVQQFTASIARQLGIRPIVGVLISGVEEGSPAQVVGIRAGQVIVSLGSYRITNMEELGIILDRVRGGETLDIGLVWSDAFGEHHGYARMQAM